jgi:hypothetical protein
LYPSQSGLAVSGFATFPDSYFLRLLHGPPYRSASAQSSSLVVLLVNQVARLALGPEMSALGTLRAVAEVRNRYSNFHLSPASPSSWPSHVDFFAPSVVSQAFPATFTPDAATGDACPLANFASDLFPVLGIVIYFYRHRSAPLISVESVHSTFETASSLLMICCRRFALLLPSNSLFFFRIVSALRRSGARKEKSGREGSRQAQRCLRLLSEQAGCRASRRGGRDAQNAKAATLH